MISSFEKWIDTSSLIQGRNFIRLYANYYESFDAWKNKDTIQIIDDIVGHFMELESLWLSVLGQKDADSEWAPAITTQQTVILKRLAGFGQLGKNRLVFARNNTLQMIGNEKVDEMPRFDAALAPETSPNVYFPVNSDKGSVDLNASLEKENEESVANEIKEYGSFLSNEQLAHELIMDPDFKLKTAPLSPLEQQVQSMGKRALHDVLHQEVANNIYSNHILGNILNLKMVPFW